MLGFEVARVWLTPDSVVAASRPKKVYLAESLSKLTSGLPINLDNLQDMLMGRPFIPGGSTVTRRLRCNAPRQLFRLIKTPSAPTASDG